MKTFRFQVSGFRFQTAAGENVAGSGAHRAMCPTCNLQPSTFNLHHAFTLLELLVVIAILGLLAALVTPALKNIGKGNATITATRQMLDDVARARQLAMSHRTTVYMVFLPTNFWGNINWATLTPAQKTAVTNLTDRQLTGYNFISYGGLGDQPGQHQWHYYGSWQSLPDGAYVLPSKFLQPGTVVSSSSSPLLPDWNNDFSHPDNNRIWTFTNLVAVPFPTADAADKIYLPCLAFNYLGQLTFDPSNPFAVGRDEYIPLVRGSIAPPIDPASKTPVLGTASILENPPGNGTNISYEIVHIDWLTGRSSLEFHKVR